MAKSLMETTAAELARLLIPLKELNDSTSLAVFIKELGWQFDEGIGVAVDLGQLISLVEELAEKVFELAKAETDGEARGLAMDLATKLPPVFLRIRLDIPAIEAAINNLPNLVGPSGDIGRVIGKRFIDYLLYKYIDTYHERLFATQQLD